MTSEERAQSREYQKKWRALNPDKTREYWQRNYARHGEARREKSRKRYLLKRDECLAASKRWRENNIDHIRIVHANWKKANRARFLTAKRIIHLKAYGLTQEDFEKMLLHQNGVCAVCKKESTNDRRLHIDHDHASGRVRGLLCTRCNCAIGLAKENPAILRELANYLESNENPFRTICG